MLIDRALCGSYATLYRSADRPILRIDEPMAQQAVATGSRIIVAAKLQSALVPTTQIVQRAATDAGKSVELLEILCNDAWSAFEKGDREGYEAEIVRELASASEGADVIILAQASMAGAADKLDTDIPVLTSPRSGFEATVRIFRNNLGQPAPSDSDHGRG